MMDKDTLYCCFCGVSLFEAANGWNLGQNPNPLGADEDRCCRKCDKWLVMPARNGGLIASYADADKRFLHHETKPAIIRPTYEAWFLNGKLHKEQGPAIYGINTGAIVGNKDFMPTRFYKNGKRVSPFDMMPGKEAFWWSVQNGVV